MEETRISLYRFKSDDNFLPTENIFAFDFNCDEISKTTRQIYEFNIEIQLHFNECYRFGVSDDGLDGICCSSGRGFYGLKWNNISFFELTAANSFQNDQYFTEFCIDSNGIVNSVSSIELKRGINDFPFPSNFDCPASCQYICDADNNDNNINIIDIESIDYYYDE